jgi:23S rRNA (pseudouridine1915-N3)-methyltransferase
MRLEIVAVGKVKQPQCRALVNEYISRLKHYLPSGQTEVREGKGQLHEVMAQEAAALSSVCAQSLRVVMDERGELLTSEQLAQRLDRWMTTGTKQVCFIIGGAAGLAPSLRDDADLLLALSPMTLPHELARVILAEQLYRAMTIIRGEPYHK